MNLQTCTYNLRKLGLISIVTVMSVSALAQVNFRSLPPDFISITKRHEATSHKTYTNVITDSTYDFFPQIDDSVGQKGIKPENPWAIVRRSRGFRNTLALGGLDGGAVNERGALFPGIEFTGWFPPDPHISVGPTHVVEVVNSHVAFFKKSDGVKLFQQSLGPGGFFSGLGVGNFVFDPRTYYDPINERFIVIALHADFGNEISDILLAVSDDTDPNGTWHKFRIESKVDDNWFDYPQVGLNQDAIAISGNMFGFAGGSNGAHVFVVKMEGLLNGVMADVTGFPMPSVFSIQPADNLGPNANPVLYGVVRDTFSSMQIFAWENLLTTPTMVSTTTAIPTWSTATRGADTTGGRKLDNLPFHFMDSGFRDGKMVAAHTVALSSGDGRSTVDWYEFDLNSWPESGSVTLAQSGKIQLPGAEHAYMPAITKNALGDISVIYTRSSTAIGADVVISTRKVGDAPGTLSPPTLLKSSTGINFQGGVGRWGDYYSAVVDPVDDTTFWGVGEIIRPDGFWATEIQNWIVSIGGPGGGGGILYEAVSVSTFLGNYFAGGLLDLENSDNGFYDIDSVFVAGRGHFGAIQADFNINEPADDVKEIKFEIETILNPGDSAAGTAFAYNWGTDRWDYVKAVRIKNQGNKVHVIRIRQNPGDYVSVSGVVRVIFRVFDQFKRNGKNPQPFRMRTDVLRAIIVTN